MKQELWRKEGTYVAAGERSLADSFKELSEALAAGNSDRWVSTMRNPSCCEHAWNKKPGLDQIDPSYRGIYESYEYCEHCNVKRDFDTMR